MARAAVSVSFKGRFTLGDINPLAPNARRERSLSPAGDGLAVSGEALTEAASIPPAAGSLQPREHIAKQKEKPGRKSDRDKVSSLAREIRKALSPTNVSTGRRRWDWRQRLRTPAAPCRRAMSPA